jgi:urease accessory protein
VQTVAGPLSGDHFELDVDVGQGARLILGTNAATLAYPVAKNARQVLRIRVAPGGRLAWLPKPLILAAGCDLESSVELELALGAAAITRELVVLGRHGEKPGRYNTELRCELDGDPLLNEAVRIDADGHACRSPAQLAGAGAYASLVLVGIDPSGAPGPGELDLAGPGRTLRALAGGSATLEAAIAPVQRSWLAALGRA